MQYFNLGILPYFPLAGGFLTGKYKQGEPPPAGWRGESSKYVQGYMTSENFTRLQHLQAFAGERDHNLNDLAHAWLLAQPQVSWVISGATRVEHVVANTSTGDWMLTEDEAAQVRKILENSVLD